MCPSNIKEQSQMLKRQSKLMKNNDLAAISKKHGKGLPKSRNSRIFKDIVI
jgi:hypothetical protein